MKLFTIILFAVTYILMIALPKKRPYVALISAVIFVVSGAMPLASVFTAIDWNVLLMLAGTMGTVALFIESKMPERMADLLLQKTPNVMWVAVALSVVSLYLLCIKGSFRLAAGDLLVLVCAVCFAVHILVIDRFSATCDGVKLSCVQFLFAGLWSAVCIPFFEQVDISALLSCALPLLYVGVFSCGVGYTLQILAQKDSNPTVVTILLSLESVFAVIAGAIILHQSMTPPARKANKTAFPRSKSPPNGGDFLHRFVILSQYPLAFLPKWGYNSCQEIHRKCMHKEVDSP